jgi:hypothetical protein
MLCKFFRVKETECVMTIRWGGDCILLLTAEASIFSSATVGEREKDSWGTTMVAILSVLLLISVVVVRVVARKAPVQNKQNSSNVSSSITQPNLEIVQASNQEDKQ